MSAIGLNAYNLLNYWSFRKVVSLIPELERIHASHFAAEAFNS